MRRRTGADVIGQVRQCFGRAFGGSPEGVWSAPGRVNLIGEHTDYNQGLCLPIALPLRTYAAASRRADGVLRIASAQREGVVEVAIDEVGPDRPGGWAAYVAGVLWALRKDGFDVGGLDVVVDTQVPVGAGLSSSAALECAAAAATSDLYGLGLVDDRAGRVRLAARCVEAENVIAGAPTGGMDQSAALLAAERSALLLDCRSGQAEQVPFDLAAGGHVLLVTDTRAEHALVDGQYAARRAACESAARELGLSSLREVAPAQLDDALSRLDDEVVRRRVRHVVTEIQRVRETAAALRANELREVGRLFDLSHTSMRDDYEISCAELDVATDTARREGALGARMTGGGFGGSCIAIVHVDAVQDVTRAIAGAFEREGFRPPESFPVTASGSAARDS
jgi:galactokinase